MTLKENLFWNCNSFCFPSNLLQGLSTRYDFSNRKKVWHIILGIFLIPEQCPLKYVKRSLAPQVLERLLLGVHVTNNLFFIPLSQDSSLQRCAFLSRSVGKFKRGFIMHYVNQTQRQIMYFTPPKHFFQYNPFVLHFLLC